MPVQILSEMKSIYLTLLLFATFITTASAQHLVSAELMYSWTPAQLMGQGVFGAQNDVAMYKIIYNTTDVHGEPTIASGAMFVPEIPGCALPVAVYDHGTIFLKNDVPSNNNGEATVGKYMGAFGYLGLLPDYLGLGESPGLHPYVHADTEASVTIDLIRAAKEYCESEEIALNDQLFITGYSQGGHAAMATVYEIETNLSDEFTVTASAPASGPYDISGSQASPVSSDQPYASPEYLPYVIFSYQLAYGNIYDLPEDFLLAPYNETLPPLFDGLHSGGQISAAMPAVPSQIIVPSELEAFDNDPNNPMRLALQDNDRYDWAPQSPMRLYYCTEDEQVFYENSLVAHSTMEANGATDVTLMDMGAYSHGDCAQLSLFDILGWFNGLKESCAGVGMVEYNGMTIELFPNPATTNVQLRLSENFSGNLRIRNVTGKTVKLQSFNGNLVEVATENLSRGLYVLTIDELPGFSERILLR